MSTNLTINFDNNLMLVHPDDTPHPTTPISDMIIDKCVTLEKEDINNYNDENYHDSMDMEAQMRNDALKKTNIIYQCLGNDKFYVRKFMEFRDKIGNGKMEYIKNTNTKLMFTNAWTAITMSNNWDFVAHHNESFMWSQEVKIDEITTKMAEYGYDGHSGSSFAYTMRNMQYLVQNGEDEFKKLFDKNSYDNYNENIVSKFMDYSGGF